MVRGYCECNYLQITVNAMKMKLSSKFLIIVEQGREF